MYLIPSPLSFVPNCSPREEGRGGTIVHFTDQLHLCRSTNRVAAVMEGLCGAERESSGGKRKKIVCIVSGGGLDNEKLVHIVAGRGVPPAGSMQGNEQALGSTRWMWPLAVAGLLLSSVLVRGRQR